MRKGRGRRRLARSVEAAVLTVLVTAAGLVGAAAADARTPGTGSGAPPEVRGQANEWPHFQTGRAGDRH